MRGPLGHRQHRAIIYRSSTEFAVTILSQVKPALEQGGSAILLLNHANRVAASRALELAELDTARVQILDADFFASAFRKSYPDNLEAFRKTLGFYVKSGESSASGRVTIVSELAAMLLAYGLQRECQALESMFDQTIGARPHEHWCIYHEASLDEEQRSQVRSVHTTDSAAESLVSASRHDHGVRN